MHGQTTLMSVPRFTKIGPKNTESRAEMNLLPQLKYDYHVAGFQETHTWTPQLCRTPHIMFHNSPTNISVTNMTSRKEGQ